MAVRVGGRSHRTSVSQAVPVALLLLTVPVSAHDNHRGLEQEERMVVNRIRTKNNTA
jgi:hypothetical protein